MRPSVPTTAEERQVIRWVFGCLFVLASCFIAWSAWSKSRDCAATCAARGFAESDLRLRGGGRFDLGTECFCSNGGEVPVRTDPGGN